MTLASATTTQIKTICLPLGPYRNLTTMTAGLLSLHPRCQVLNHAGQKLLGDPATNFLNGPTNEKVHAFLAAALDLARGGQRGQEGGSITKSHAFDPQHPMGRLYRERFGDSLDKPGAEALFWKESLHASNFLRGNSIDVPGLLAAEARLQFLVPIRNPLDCAYSNIATSHTRFFADLAPEAGILQVTEAVLDLLLWSTQQALQCPERFLLLFEHQMGRSTLSQLAEFLGLEPEEQWLDDATEACQLKPGYCHEPALVDAYVEMVKRKFADFPPLQAGLLHFANRSPMPGPEPQSGARLRSC